MVALSRLPVKIIAFASCDKDEHTRRLMRRRWPGLIEWNDVCQVSRIDVEKLGAVFGLICDFVIVGGGSPCQDLSSLKSGRKGLAGSKSALFFEVPRIIGLLREEFDGRIHWMAENVFSMTGKIGDAFQKSWTRDRSFWMLRSSET